jgi:hypothetical protein
MKTSLRITLALAALLSVRLSAEQAAVDQPRSQSLIDQLAPTSLSNNPRLDLVVVSEVTAENAKSVRPTPDQPAYYVAFDDGYRESGDPVGNENPPTAAEVARALRQTLAAEGYRPATNQSPATLLLSYHWGSLNVDSLAIKTSMDLDPNLKARLSLVADKRNARRIEDEILQRRLTRESRGSIPSAGYLTPQARDLWELARDNRYFVIVSAYDYAALQRHETRLLWRAKMSASNAGVAMAAALPALIRGGGPYFGRSADEPQFVRTPLAPGGKVEAGMSAMSEAADLTGAAGQLDASFVREFVEKEGAELTGTQPRATAIVRS